ncbi:ArfGap-domain-containing protein [Choiromyces venosus 120613-1]|uniref:ArfGap-domain-containing protein n=1 Tax=Choiromyces venosus 120613-1 TaxID=1336337 RepID=A0A3N4JHJ5_9PEZI|nr:ArfGap-domain-containing protein [Choiromyces venosus 120613-1]
MSRRPNPAADKAAQNQQVIKSLLKLPGNKVCADCKRNKLPRWASWNLGVFICIRCSGIHRGMGTHISRVKSVDLDSWTDEQLQSMLKWGNSRANKYWEANLAPGHVPSEAKIENFVRTKYESKRWVMEGGIPDPATLEDSAEEDNLPLKVVQQKLENRQTPASPPQQQARRQNVNLFDDDDVLPQEPSRSNSVPPASKNQPPPKASPAPPKSTKPADSLLGLDFFAAAPAPAPRPASVNSNPVSNTSSSRPDLNRSILSLYASKPQPRPQHVSTPSIASSQQLQNPSSGLGELNDAFGGFGFGSQPNTTSLSTQPTAPPVPKPSPFANLTAGMMKSSAAPQLSPASTGGFFGSSGSSMAANKKPAPIASASFGLEDFFDFSSTPSAPAAQPPMRATSSFSPAAAKPAASAFSFESNAWASPAPTTSTATTKEPAWGASASAATSSNHIWGSPATPTPATLGTLTSTTAAGFGATKNEEDEWGAFNSGVTRAGATTGTSTSTGAYGKSGGFGGDDDVFANVWK